jgi:hypothetical protein
MSFRLRIHYYAVLGAIGALIGWRITESLGFLVGAIPDLDMAPQHARLKGAETLFVLEDMSVGKGTFVNGRQVEMARLTTRSTIRVGNTEMVYHERR